MNYKTITILFVLAFVGNSTCQTGEIYTHFLGFQLSKSNLIEIQKKLGKAKICKGNEIQFNHINYFFENDSNYVSFVTDEYDSEIISEIVVSTIKPNEQITIQNRIKLSKKDLNGIYPRMKLNQIKEIIKDKSLFNGDTTIIPLGYSRDVTSKEIAFFKSKGSKLYENMCSVSILLTLICHDDILVKLQISKTESYF